MDEAQLSPPGVTTVEVLPGESSCTHTNTTHHVKSDTQGETFGSHNVEAGATNKELLLALTEAIRELRLEVGIIRRDLTGVKETCESRLASIDETLSRFENVLQSKSESLTTAEQDGKRSTSSTPVMEPKGTESETAADETASVTESTPKSVAALWPTLNWQTPVPNGSVAKSSSFSSSFTKLSASKFPSLLARSCTMPVSAEFGFSEPHSPPIEMELSNSSSSLMEPKNVSPCALFSDTPSSSKKPKQVGLTPNPRTLRATTRRQNNLTPAPKPPSGRFASSSQNPVDSSPFVTQSVAVTPVTEKAPVAITSVSVHPRPSTASRVYCSSPICVPVQPPTWEKREGGTFKRGSILAAKAPSTVDYPLRSNTDHHFFNIGIQIVACLTKAQADANIWNGDYPKDKDRLRCTITIGRRRFLQKVTPFPPPSFSADGSTENDSTLSKSLSSDDSVLGDENQAPAEAAIVAPGEKPVLNYTPTKMRPMTPSTRRTKAKYWAIARDMEGQLVFEHPITEQAWVTENPKRELGNTGHYQVPCVFVGGHGGDPSVANDHWNGKGIVVDNPETGDQEDTVKLGIKGGAVWRYVIIENPMNGIASFANMLRKLIDKEKEEASSWNGSSSKPVGLKRDLNEHFGTIEAPSSCKRLRMEAVM